jgi:hypothetical protein
VDYFVYKSGILPSQLLGMGFIILCAVLVSLSPIIVGEIDIEEEDASAVSEDDVFTGRPIYQAILASFLAPFCLSFFIVYLKYVTTVKKIAGRDLAIGYYSIMSIIFALACVFHFTNKNYLYTFEPFLFLMGSLGSAFQLAGVFFAVSGIATGKALGPQTALILSQTILNTGIHSIISRKVPNYVQLIGLAIGFVGALVLVIPDKIKAMLCCSTK